MDLADFIAPMPTERFLADYYGKQPVLIRDDNGGRRELFSWRRLNALLGILPHWTETNIKLILNSSPIAPQHYFDEVRTMGGPVRRASPAKIDVFLGMGASLVANAIEDIAPDVRTLTSMLSASFAGSAGANAYCSFQGVQAFKSHCDLHEVFAVHCEGEKRWRIYENRALAPLVEIEGDGAQAIIDGAKGRVMMDITMQPGDLLYIPRGFYHDALASSTASLHLTLSVAPHSGRILFRLLEEMALQDPDFRSYLPDGRSDGAGLGSRLSELAEKVAAMMQTPAFASEVINRQRALASPSYAFALPDRPKLNFLARTDTHAEVVRRDEGAYLRLRNGEAPLGRVGDAADWLLEQSAFSIEQLLARYPWQPEDELRALVDLVRRADLFRPYKPALS